MKRTLLFLFACFALAACQQSQDAPARAVESYFKALIAKDANAVANLACADFEADAQIDLDTFSLNPATLESIACQSGEKSGEFTLVACAGKIIFDYNGEKQEVDLATRTYQTVEEGGEWRMCGYR
jgi:hypothetical protein